MFVRTGVSASGELGCSLPLCGGLGWCGEIRVAPPVEESDTPTPPKVPPKPRSPRFHRLVCEEPTRWLERLRSGEIAENEMHNGLMTCAACGRSLAEDAAWKGSGERYSSSVRMPKRRNRHRATPPVRPNRVSVSVGGFRLVGCEMGRGRASPRDGWSRPSGGSRGRWHLATFAAANSSRAGTWLPRASARSRASACDPHGGRRRAQLPG